MAQVLEILPCWRKWLANQYNHAFCHHQWSSHVIGLILHDFSGFGTRQVNRIVDILSGTNIMDGIIFDFDKGH